MAILDELVTQIENPDLRARIAAEVEKLAKQKKFGLVFEEHLPECTPLWDIPVKKGGKVALKTGQVSDFYTVLQIEDGIATCLNKDKSATAEFKVDELVSVAEFGEPIYPYLKPIDKVCNAPDSDLWHTLIEADNYHALQLLEYLYAGKVDCIYIDPPYNTGARDWKYNNDYVDGNDQYRHSKWLSMMEKRLRLAKKLLSKDGALVCAIDENEVNTLGLLLQEIFSEYIINCISIIHNPGGIQGANFSFCHEYAYFVFPNRSNYITKEKRNTNGDLTPFRDWGKENSKRRGSPNCFYPIFVDIKANRVVGSGNVPDDDFHPASANEIDGDILTVWPIDAKGIERRWRFAFDTVHEILDELVPVPIKGIVNIQRNKQWFVRKTVWSDPSYFANNSGSQLIASMIGNRFTFPKSLYLTRECLKAVLQKPNALIVDFFAGSGTTLHAVNLLNAEDGGHRRCIMVTNNEVSDAEAKEMAKRGLKPGDDEWEKLGIARYVTWPRTVCSIEGHDVNGKPLKGDYITSGEEPMHMADGFKANAAFFKLGFLDKDAVALGRQFKELLPTLWMKAGAHGACPTIGEEPLDMLILPENKFAVLVDEKAYMAFAEKLDEHPEIETVFIVTDSESGYRDMIAGLDVKASYQLYRDYLDNFRINAARR